MISIITSFLIPWLIGFSLVYLLSPRQDFRSYFLVRLSLALGLGFGVSSSLLFLWLSVFGEFHKAFKVTELAICLLGLAGLLLKKLSSLPEPSVPKEPEEKKILEKILGPGFFLLLFFGIGIMVIMSLYYPHGNWDAWAIWNNRARFIFRAADNWQVSFSPLLGWSHPDYPLLIPLSIARCWFYIGTEKWWVPMVIALLFSVSIMVLLVSALSLVQNKSQGYLGGIILLSTPHFLLHSTSQYADIPLAFYFLSVIVLFYLYDQSLKKNYGLLLMGGGMAGFSAWTKNEGLLFVVLVFLILLVFPHSRKGWKEWGRKMTYFISGLIPVIVLIGYFKIFQTPPNDLISMLRTDRLISNLFDPERYFLIIKSLWSALLNFGQWPFTPIPILFSYFIWTGRSSASKKETPILLVPVFQLLGYFLVFLFTPQELKWHLVTSLDRLVLQLWPGFLFAGFVYIRTPEERLMNQNIKPFWSRETGE